MKESIKIINYRWAGSWGPFKVNIPCGECALTEDIIYDVIAKELADIPVEIERLNWLSNWWRPILKGGWHAPIVMVDGEVISQGVALNRGILTEAVIKAYAKKKPLEGNIVYGKKSCVHCEKALALLDEADIKYKYYDIIENSYALYEMLVHVKPIVGPKTPITTPQIWLDGEYVGGADALDLQLTK